MPEEPTNNFHQERKSLWTANLITFALLIIFVLVLYAIENLAKPVFTPSGLIAVSIAIAIIPALLWLGFYYRQDHLEPEPKGKILQVFILGCLLASAIGIPLVNKIYTPATWLFANDMVNILGAILVVGFSQEFLKYACVRFTIYNTAEFDERVDGIIYMTAAGLGFATMLNISYVLTSGGVNLGFGAIRVVLTILAQASFAGLTGYFLSKEKLDHWSAWLTLAGVSLAAILNGLFYYLRGILSRPTISSSGFTINPWTGFVLAAAIAIVVTGILSWLIHRDQINTINTQEA